MEDFLSEMAPFKAKSPQFPSPETLYKKKFAFLSAPLLTLQKTRRATDPTPSSHSRAEESKGNNTSISFTVITKTIRTTTRSSSSAKRK